MIDTDEDIVRKLSEIDHGLSPWEVEFVESLHHRVMDQGLPLTDRQREVAERILDEKA